jgi:hypothetical protein
MEFNFMIIRIVKSELFSVIQGYIDLGKIFRKRMHTYLKCFKAPDPVEERQD